LRLQLFEFEDLPWFPQVIREGMMDFLRHLITWMNFYGPVTPLIKETLTKTNGNRLLELCAGGGGGVMKLKKNLHASGCDPEIVLSDLYPNADTYQQIKNESGGTIDFVGYSVNALDVPAQLKGMRLLFSSFHHFRPDQAKAILADAFRKNVAIGIFDAGTKSFFSMLAVIILQPVIFLLATPFFKPFRWSRLLFTYVVPLIPICTMWDGCVSILRFYTVSQLQELTSSLKSEGYQWKTGQVKNSIGAKVNYVIGYSQNQIPLS
jgi:hypothetical protein